MWKPSKAAHPLTNAFTNLSAAGALALALAGCNDTAAQHAAPIRPVIIEHRSHFVGPCADPSAHAPTRIVFHTVGRVGDHQMRLDATERRINCATIRAVAAGQMMSPE